MVLGVGLRLFACWDFEFEPCLEYEYLSLVSAVCCQVEVSETSLSLVQGVLPSVVCLSVIRYNSNPLHM